MASDPAAAFQDMVERIGKMNTAEFAGAVVVVPPEGDTMVFVTAELNPDSIHFWADLEARVQVRKQEIIQSQQVNSPYGRR